MKYIIPAETQPHSSQRKIYHARSIFIVQNEIMKKNREVEQVGIILNVQNDICTFRMVGDEFCGNACRCAAAYMKTNYGKMKSRLFINALEVGGEADCLSSKITLKEKKLIRKLTPRKDGSILVEMNGMTIIVGDNPSLAENYDQIKTELAWEEPIPPAIGVMYIKKENNQLFPFVWVRDADTFFEETGCVSGSIAAALFLKEKQQIVGDFKTSIRQRCGSEYSVSFVNGQIGVAGEVLFVKKNSVKINFEKIRKTYEKIKKTFVRYADTATIQIVCRETDEEEFSILPNNLQSGEESIFVRKTVLNKLLAAEKWLRSKNKDFQLIVAEGYRSLAMQKQRFAEVYDKLKLTLQNKTEMEILEKCHEQIAVPIVAGHPTGGAVDVLVLDTATKKTLDFGTGYCDWSADEKKYFASPEISKQERKNRQLLRKAMTQAGFAPYNAEWWHFSYGDKEWAVYYNKEKYLYNQKELREMKM